jgi:hypothetical protein
MAKSLGTLSKPFEISDKEFWIQRKIRIPLSPPYFITKDLRHSYKVCTDFPGLFPKRSIREKREDQCAASRKQSYTLDSACRTESSPHTVRLYSTTSPASVRSGASSKARQNTIQKLPITSVRTAKGSGHGNRLAATRIPQPRRCRLQTSPFRSRPRCLTSRNRRPRRTASASTTKSQFTRGLL